MSVIVHSRLPVPHWSSDFHDFAAHTSTQPLLYPVGHPTSGTVRDGPSGPEGLPGYTIAYASNFAGKSLPVDGQLQRTAGERSWR